MIRAIFFALCLASGHSSSFGQCKGGGNHPRARSVSLRQVGRYAEDYTPGTLKIARVVLEDFRPVEDDWVHVFQLYDLKSGVRRGEVVNGRPYGAHSFLICTNEEIGKPLLERKEKWLNRNVNVYLKIIDRGLTTHMYVGYVTKVELLDEKGRVVESISSKG